MIGMKNTYTVISKVVGIIVVKPNVITIPKDMVDVNGNKTMMDLDGVKNKDVGIIIVKQPVKNSLSVNGKIMDGVMIMAVGTTILRVNVMNTQQI